MQTSPQIPAEGKKTGIEEHRLVAEVLNKDRKATAEFVAFCADCMYPFVRRRLMPRMEAVDDVMQESLLAAWQHLPNFHGGSTLSTWIMGIARHKVQDHYRKRIREVNLSEEGAAQPEMVPHFEERLDAETQQKKVRMILGRLPEAYALALLWRYRENMSIREMAELADKSEKAIERLLARARQSFRRAWDDLR